MKKLLLCSCLSLFAIQVQATELPTYYCGKDVICKDLGKPVVPDILDIHTKQPITGQVLLIYKNTAPCWDENTSVKATLLNGKLNGTIGTYIEHKGSTCPVHEANYKDGLLDGVRRSFHIIRREEYEFVSYDSSVLGCTEHTRYYPGGLEREEYYKAGKKEGIEKKYYENGKLEYEANYKNGELDGIEKRYRFVKRHYYLEYEAHYKDGEVDEKEYYENGNLKYEAHYKDGEMIDEVKIEIGYYDKLTKKLQYEKRYRNNKLDGIEKNYYKNGNLKSEVNYKNGKIDGIQKDYYENGNLEREATFDGNLNGIEKKYDENGKLEYEAHYKNGKIDSINGIWKDYYGKGVMVSIFKDNKLISQTFYDKNGNVIKK